MRFAQQTIEEVRAAAQLLDIAGEHVVLKKKGKEYAGLCPFHNEKSPSFTVNPVNGFYYCHGCGAGGDAIHFVQEVNRFSFSEAVLDLAERYQIHVTLENPEQEKQFKERLLLQKRLLDANRDACTYFQLQLRGEQARGGEVWQYLQERGVQPKELGDWQLGYAPKGWGGLLKHLKESGHSEEILLQAGLISSKEGRAFDFFRNRLIFPLIDPHGRVIGFSGRAISDGDMPKYLHTAETEIFHKGRFLYGMHRAADEITKAEQVIFVEGFFDVIALHRAGVSNVVASMGTALSLLQIRQAVKPTSTKRFMLLFDSDRAGQEAVERALEEAAPLIRAGEVKASVLKLPGKDPDEFLAKSQGDFRQVLQTAESWFDWKLGRLIESKNLDEVGEFQQASKEVLTLLQSISDAANRANAVRRCAERLGRGKPALVGDIEQALRRKLSPRDKTPKRLNVQTLNHLERAELKLLQIYLHCPLSREEIRAMMTGCGVEFYSYRAEWEEITAAEERGGANLFAQWLSDRQSGCPKELMPSPEVEDFERCIEVMALAVCQLEKVKLQEELDALTQRWVGGEDGLGGQLKEVKTRIREIDAMRRG